MLKPKLFETLKNYDRQQFGKDLMAGLIVGIVALPLAIAFAIASGVSPEKGIYTAIIGGFIISALGGSKVQIGGPTGAFIVIVYGIVQQYGIDGLIVATFIAGIMLIIMGFDYRFYQRNCIDYFFFRNKRFFWIENGRSSCKFFGEMEKLYRKFSFIKY
jgi:hypothetical protein